MFAYQATGRQPLSVTLVFGCRVAAAPEMYFPVMALRWCVPLLRLAPLSLTLVRGCRAAAAREMYLPVMALRVWPRAMMNLHFWRSRGWIRLSAHTSVERFDPSAVALLS